MAVYLIIHDVYRDKTVSIVKVLKKEDEAFFYYFCPLISTL